MKNVLMHNASINLFSDLGENCRESFVLPSIAENAVVVRKKTDDNEEKRKEKNKEEVAMLSH